MEFLILDFEGHSSTHCISCDHVSESYITGRQTQAYQNRSKCQLIQNLELWTRPALRTTEVSNGAPDL